MKRLTDHEWNKTYDQAEAEWTTKIAGQQTQTLKNHRSALRVALATTAGTHTGEEAAQSAALIVVTNALFARSAL